MRRHWTVCVMLAVLLLSVASLSAQTVSLSSTSVNFGSQAVLTTSAAKTVRLTNTGTAPLLVSSITPPSAPFADPKGTGACPSTSFSLAAGTYCTIGVTFSPTTTGSFSGSVSVTDNASNSPQTITLAGIGVAQASLSTATLNFGNVGVGTSSTKNITLYNSLPMALAFSGATATGDFVVTTAATNPCGSSVPAVGHCSIGVTFTPTQLGARTGTLTVNDSANNSPQTAVFNGTGSTLSVSKVAAACATSTVAVGATDQCTATGTFPGGIVLNLTTAVNWSSSSTKVLTISNTAGSQGLATGKAAGTTTVKAALNVGETTKSGSTSVTVTAGGLITPTITWPTPAPITYGTALTSAQLDATVVVNGTAIAGTYVYTPSAGTALPAGNQTLSVLFTPTDTTHYTTAMASVMLTVNKATATVTLSNLSQTYTGSPLTPTATTVPSGLTVAFTGAPDTTAGTYPVTATVNDTNYNGSASGSFVIGKATVTVTLSNLSQTYTGSALSPTVTTTPTGLAVNLTGAPDTNAGTYPISATVTDPNYSGTAAGSFVVSQATPTITVTGGTFTQDGNPHSATATATGIGGATVHGTFVISYNGSTTVPSSAGIYTVSAAFTSTDPNYASTVGAGTITISAPTATLDSIAVTPANTSTPLGGTQQFTATGTYSDGSTAPLTATWSSSSAVATISSGGLATAASSGCGGPTTITATSGSVSGSTVLTVSVMGGFACGGNMTIARDPHTATRLADGRVLITGGYSPGFAVTNTAEIYDPATNMSTATGSMNTARAYHTATLLASGTVLITGGQDNSNNVLSSAEIFDPTKGTFTLTGGMSAPREGHTATLLQNGKVFVAGGSGLSSTEMYDPNTGLFSDLAVPMLVARTNHTASLFLNGVVLLAGGTDSTNNPTNSYEIFDTAQPISQFVFDGLGMQVNMTDARVYQTATLLNDGRVLIVGGLSSFTTTSAVTSATADIFDPGTQLMMSTVSGPNTARFNHTATLLPSGLVLLAGGETTDPLNNYAPSYLSSAELFDPTATTSAAFTTTPYSFNTARAYQTDTLLENGDVLFTGGSNGSNPLQSTELYTPASLVPAGISGGLIVSPSNIQIPVGTGPTTFTAFAVINGAARTQNQVTWSTTPAGVLSITNSIYEGIPGGVASIVPAIIPTIPAGGIPVTVAACFGSSAACGSATVTVTPPALTSIAITPVSTILSYPSVTTQQFTATGTYTDGSTATLFSATWSSLDTLIATIDQTGFATVTGTVGSATIEASGPGANGTTIVASATLSVTDNFLFGTLPTARLWSTATMLSCACSNNGKILIVGGADNNYNVIGQALLYDPVSGAVTSSSSSLNFPRIRHTATVLANGQILIAGGNPDWYQNTYVAAAEIYDPTTDGFTIVGSLNTPRVEHSATLLNNGKVLIAAGFDGTVLSSAELFDPTTTAFTITGSLATARVAFSATYLPSGKVLFAGGANANGSADSAELYDPTTGTFAATGSLHSSKPRNTATMLNNGLVLIAAGGSAELYDPTSGTFSNNVPPLLYGHSAGTATLLMNGMVLFAGGDSSLTTELYDPTSNTFVSSKSLLTARENHSAILLTTGKVVLIGGDNITQGLTSIEVISAP